MDKLDKYLKEAVHIDLYNYLEPKQRNLVGKVAKELDWGIESTYAFVLELMTDVNAHTAAAKVEKILLADLKRVG